MKIANILFVFVFLGALPFLKAQERDSLPHSHGATAPSCECSFLIRIDRHMIEPPTQRVQSRDAVDHMVLGTRAVGTSQTTGTMRVTVDEHSVEPALYIAFDGQTSTRTNGSNGPAIIRCRTTTTSHCLRKIVFTLEHGFVANPSQISTTSHLLVDDIQTNVPGLRGRLVQRIARRRTQESHSQARAIIDQQTRSDIRQEFETAVDQYLVELNRQFKTIRQLAALSGHNAKLRMKVMGENGQSVVLYLAPDDDTSVVLPELGKAQAKAEVWIKNPSLPSLSAVPTALSTMFARQVPGMAGVLAVTPLLKVPAAEEGERLGYRTQGDWTIIGVNNTRSPIARRPTQPASRKLASARDSDSTP